MADLVVAICSVDGGRGYGVCRLVRDGGFGGGGGAECGGLMMWFEWNLLC